MPHVSTLNYQISQHVISRFSTWDYWVYWSRVNSLDKH